MAQKLETIKGGGGSIRIGTAGTISSLMNRELEAPSSSSYTPPSSSSRATPTAISVSVSCGHRSLKPRKSTDVASTSSGHPGPITKHRSPETSQRTRAGSDPMTPKRQKQKTSPPDEDSSTRRSPRRIHGRTRHAPMLGSENAAPDKTPNREKPLKKGINIVQVVDTSCGSPRASLSNRLRKLGFSKMSQSII